MKKILSLLTLLAAVATANAQGYFTPSTANSDSSFGAHTGGTVFDAANGNIRCFGSGYQGQYYFGPAGTVDPNALVAVGGVGPFLGSSSASLSAGYFNADGNDVVINGTPGGQSVVIQLRAWQGTAGSTYAAANNRGSSGLMTIVLATSPASGTPVTTMANFSINTVPEPATIALGLMGAGALFIRRRKS